MRTFIVTDDKIYTETIFKNEQIALYAWKINKQSPKYKDAAFYNIYFFNSDDLIEDESNILDKKLFSDVNRNDVWEYYKKASDLKWLTISKTVHSFYIFSYLDDEDEEKKDFFRENIRSRRSVNRDKDTDWQYQIIVKSVIENLNEGILPEIIGDLKPSDCLKSIKTTGENKTLAAYCPINPETNTQMDMCLNWRRNDQIGKFCSTKLSESEKTYSINEFCIQNPNSDDCKCVNRILHEDYNKHKKEYSQPDHCWYGPCASGYYLSDTNEKFDCGNNIYCQVFYDVERTGKNVNISNNVMSCSEAQKLTKKVQPTFVKDSPPKKSIPDFETTNNGLEIKILAISIIVVFILMIIK